MKPSVYHALVVIFLEFFAWGLLTTPTITVTRNTFPEHTFLCNGLIQGVKGILSFLSAPMVGALSDVIGRKPFLLITVACTCAPIPFMLVSPWWYFALISLSGAFAVTFSVVFAYVADITCEEERSSAYGLVSATFAASLITSPAIGAFLERAYSQNVVILIATAVAAADIFFILVFMPESLSEKIRISSSWGSHISWEKADPFGALKKLGHDRLILLLCLTVLLSYLPEAGEYSSFFVYLRLVMNFTEQEVASYIAFVGILSVLAQTLLLALLMTHLGAKNAIIVGLTAECIQLTLYGFGSTNWLMWIAGCVASISSITYPAISAFVSSQASPDQQGVAQGVITGIRGLCNGIGPALFGLIFFLFDVNLNDGLSEDDGSTSPKQSDQHSPVIPGPPFAFGAILVMAAIAVATHIPEAVTSSAGKSTSNGAVRLPRQTSRHNSVTNSDGSLSHLLTGSSGYETEKLLAATEEHV
ncbi:hippocampus abundant transcript 1 protein-like isoform X2 [Watersipora subatra]